MLVSVILPAYNAQDTIAESIDSILNQSFRDFELIVINDGSTDATEKVIAQYDDSRIRYFANPGNQGLIYTLNRGLELSQGKYIARMDADDISLPARFEKQVRILEEHPEIIVCGTQIKGFGLSKASKYIFTAKEKSGELKYWLLKYPCFAHPSVMIRRQVLTEHHICYDKDYLHAEDYKLWVDLSSYGDFYNIQEVLLRYRISDTQITQKNNFKQAEGARKCRREYIEKFCRDEFITRSVREDKITVNTLKAAKRYLSKELLEVLYMSLSQYTLKEFLYFVQSGDFFKWEVGINLAILKRFLCGKNPVL